MTPQNNWEADFDEKFGHYNPVGREDYDGLPTWNGGDYQQIKSFIRSVEEKAREDEREKIESMFDHPEFCEAKGKQYRKCAKCVLQSLNK